jgi:hypothetical protein
LYPFLQTNPSYWHRRFLRYNRDFLYSYKDFFLHCRKRFLYHTALAYDALFCCFPDYTALGYTILDTALDYIVLDDIALAFFALDYNTALDAPALFQDVFAREAFAYTALY